MMSGCFRKGLWLLPLAVAFAACDCGGNLPWAQGDGDGDGDGIGDGDGDTGPDAIDVLFVVDNSGSMCEEQQNLIDNLFDPDCPITDLGNVPAEYQDPDEDTLATLSDDCGMLQVMAALRLDARVGFLSTDVGPCDNRFGIADNPNFLDHPSHCGEQPDDWGRRPQRGCLQAAPGATRKYVDMTQADAQAQLAANMSALGTYGSGYERGMDSVQIFLEADSPAPGCEDDAASFLRPGADLVVVFVSDEDDCSHPGSATFPDENEGEDCQGMEAPGETKDPPVSESYCYEYPGELTPVSDFISFFERYEIDEDKKIRMAVVAGAVYEGGAADPTPMGCLIGAEGKPDGTCTESEGTSIYTIPGSFCDPDRLDAEGLPPCCEADGAPRYFELASAFGEDGFVDSICYDSFRQTLVDVARLAAAD